MSWQSILKTFIAGTERSPLPDSEFAGLGLEPASDPAQKALEALAAGNLARKAGFQLAVSAFAKASADEGSFTRRSHSEGGSSGQWQSVVPAPILQSLIPSLSAAKDLNLMPSGRYAGVLPEFLDLLVQNNLQLPPEVLPDLLDKAERDETLTEMIRPALGSRGEWLARQNPRWSALVAGEEADWFTASFAERKRLLRLTRARNPLLALAWLEKTWLEEKADHKAQFLELLRVRLSPADEGLLEKAFADKSREVRLAAIQALVLLPESRFLAEMKVFFKERFEGIYLPPASLQKETLLKKSLPDMSDEALRPWFGLLSEAAKSDWRNELLRLFIRLLPPAEQLALSSLTRDAALRALDDAEDAAALLEALVRHNDGSWTEAVLQHFSRDFRHAVWQSKEMTAFLTRFAIESMTFLQKNAINIGTDNACFLRTLENCSLPWPKPMLDHLLDQYQRAAITEEAEIPGWHYTSALKAAALHCRPEDAASNAFVRHYLQNPSAARPREFEEFLAMIRFRQGMNEHLGI